MKTSKSVPSLSQIKFLSQAQEKALVSILISVFFCIYSPMVQAQASLLQQPSSPNANEKAETAFKFAADDWCPFTCQGKLTDQPGIITEVVYQSLKSAGLNMKYDVISWARAIKLAEANKIHGVLGAYVSDLPHFLFSEKPIITSKDCFFVKDTDSWQFQKLSDLKSRRIGIIKDYGYGEAIDKEKVIGQEKYFFEVSGDNPLQQNIKKLAVRRLDTILENEMVISYLKKQNGLAGLKSAGCLEDKAIYAALNPTAPENKKVIAALNQFLNSKPEEVKKIIQKYQPHQ